MTIRQPDRRQKKVLILCASLYIYLMFLCFLTCFRTLLEWCIVNSQSNRSHVIHPWTSAAWELGIWIIPKLCLWCFDLCICPDLFLQVVKWAPWVVRTHCAVHLNSSGPNGKTFNNPKTTLICIIWTPGLCLYRIPLSSCNTNTSSRLYHVFHV